MATILVEILGNAKQLKAELASAQASTARASGGFSRMGKVAGVVGAALAGGVVFGLAKAASAAGDFESQLNTLQAVSGVNNAQLKELSKQAIQLGADIKLPGTSALDASQAMTELIKAGVSVKNTQSGVRDVLVLSAAAHIGNAQAAEIGANAMNAFGLRGKQMKKVVDELANTANASSVEILDVADAFKNAGSVFKAFQGPVVGSVGAMSELNTAIGILGNAGIKGGEAGTTLKMALLRLGAPTEKAKAAMAGLYAAATDASTSEENLNDILTLSKKKRDELLDTMGKSNKALAAGGNVAYDASGKMRSLKDIVELLRKGTAAMTQEQKNAYLTQIFGAKAIRGAIILMRSQSDEAKKLGQDWDSMAKAVDKNGSAQALATAKMKGFKGAQQALQSSIETLQITIGLKLLPVLTVLTNYLAVELPVAVAGLSSLLDNNRTTFEVLGGAVGVVLAGLLAYKIGVVAASVATKLWAVATAAYTAVQWLANAAVVAFNIALSANPIGILIVAVAALAAGMVILYKNSGTARTIMNEVWGDIKSVAMPIINWFTDTGLPAFKAAWGTVGPAVRASLEIATAPIRAIWDTFKNVADLIGDLIHGRWSAMWGDAKKIVSDLFSDLGKPLVDAMKLAINDMIGVFNAGANVIADHWPNIPGAPGPPFGHNPIPKLGMGGIVTRPTLALIGEAGPEAVIPLGSGGAMGGNTFIVNNNQNMDPRAVARAWSWQAKHVVA